MGLAAVPNKTTTRVGLSFAAVLFAGVTGWSAAIAVVLAKDGEAKLVRRRETYEDLLSCEVWPLE